MTEGSNLQLFCQASGKPAPNITWVQLLQDGSESEVLHWGHTWIFLNITSAQAGTYRCTAYNGVGDPVTHSLTVNVLCKYVYNSVSFLGLLKTDKKRQQRFNEQPCFIL